MHLVGFIIRIYHDAWSPECQNLKVGVTKMDRYLSAAKFVNGLMSDIVHLARNRHTQVNLFPTSCAGPCMKVTPICFSHYMWPSLGGTRNMKVIYI